MKIYCEVEIKDRTPSSIQDAIAYACRHDELWRVRLSMQERREQMKKNTDLTGKCGSCIHFKEFGYLYAGSTCYGECDAGHVCGARSRRACKEYERKKDK